MEQILVCLSGAPSNAKVIKAAAKMAEAYGGKLTFAKREGGGLIARVTFPVWRETTGKDAAPAAGSAAGNE